MKKTLKQKIFLAINDAVVMKQKKAGVEATGIITPNRYTNLLRDKEFGSMDFINEVHNRTNLVKGMESVIEVINRKVSLDTEEFDPDYLEDNTVQASPSLINNASNDTILTLSAMKEIDKSRYARYIALFNELQHVEDSFKEEFGQAINNVIATINNVADAKIELLGSNDNVDSTSQTNDGFIGVEN